MKNKLIKTIRTYPKVFLTALILMLGAFSFSVGTYAWYVSSDQTVNSFKGTVFQSKLTEVFAPVVNWNPNETKTKGVAVQNAGDTPSMVRISLYEFLLDFEVNYTDKTGNANLNTRTGPVNPIVNDRDTSTWKPASKSSPKGTYLADNGKYYIANYAMAPSTNPLDKEMYTYSKDPTKERMEYVSNQKEENVHNKLQYFQLNFNPNLVTEFNANNQEGYWLYENGFFYYSKSLNPGEMTSNLLESVTLAYNFPNKYKNALYAIEVYLDAHDSTTSIFTDWQLDQNSEAKKLLNAQIN